MIASDMAKAYVRCGSDVYWTIVLSLVPLTAVVSACAAVWLTRKYTAKVRAGLHLIKGEVRRTFCVPPERKTVLVVVTAVMAAAAAMALAVCLLASKTLPAWKRAWSPATEP